LESIFPAEDQVIDLSHAQTRTYGFGDATNEIKRWQGFVATQSARVTAVEVLIRARSGPPPSPLTVELYAMKDGVPTGTALASNSMALPQLTTKCVVVRCPLPYDKLKKGESYAIVLGQVTPHPWCYMWETAKFERDVPGFEQPLRPTAGDFPFGKWTGAQWKPEPGCGVGWLKVYLE
jgi:hypothetical protein